MYQYRIFKQSEYCYRVDFYTADGWKLKDFFASFDSAIEVLFGGKK